jgi:nephrocystin-4
VYAQVEAYPAMNPARPLLPQDFLVSYTDIIPGLRRFDLAGQPSTALHSSLNTLASPLLADMCVVSFEGVQLVVPQLLHNLLSVLPELLGALP